MDDFVDGVWRAYAHTAQSAQSEECAKDHFMAGFAAMASLLEASQDMRPDHATDLLQTVIGQAKARTEFRVHVQAVGVIDKRRLDS